MSEKSIRLRVLTSDRLAIEDEAVSVIAPGGVGYVGMLRNHAPMVSTVGKGKLSWRRPDGSRQTVMISGGVLEIVKNALTILTDTVTTSSDVTQEIHA